jgi:hypothetical protein
MSYFSGIASAVDGLAVAVRLAALAALIKSNKAFCTANQSGPLGALVAGLHGARQQAHKSGFSNSNGKVDVPEGRLRWFGLICRADRITVRTPLQLLRGAWCFATDDRCAAGRGGRDRGNRVVVSHPSIAFRPASVMR